MREDTRKLIFRLLAVTENLKSIPRGARTDFRLLYTEGTPANYEPEGFEACKELCKFTRRAPEVRIGAAHAKFNA